ncbi:hypothetical protein B7463_g5273, partial [Scytalidium lignicola]
MSSPEDIKKQDPYIFKTADDFFRELDETDPPAYRPRRVSYNEKDQLLNNKWNPVSNYGRIFRLNGRSYFLLQFMRPKVWRIQFDPQFKTPDMFSDYNTRTIVQDTLSDLIETLDAIEHIRWGVEFIEDPQYFILQSVKYEPREIVLQIWIQRNPFKMTAVRMLKSLPPADSLPRAQTHHSDLDMESTQGVQKAVIWKTKESGLQVFEKATILSVEKSVTANYMGFGEQGGKHLFKKDTYMNYFNFDNIHYSNVYGLGPYDDREPLYHSEPYWIEVNANPGYQSHVATFIDNYSHVCVDLGHKDPTTLRVATRFNSFQCILMAGDNFEEIIQLYTSLIGRPRLKPRYVLGYHQGCYGYSTQEEVMEVVEQYRKHNFPIDGMHIDVDIQEDYSTFTIDRKRFPHPYKMFSDLRRKGVKCGTNITPYVNSCRGKEYKVYNSLYGQGYYVKDIRDESELAKGPEVQRYLQYGYGHDPNPYMKDPTTESPPYKVDYPQNFTKTYQSKNGPFYGGVYYGNGNGHPGIYPNLNDTKVRKWWGKQYRDLFKYGLEFVWQDMTSPCIAEEFGDMKSFPFRLLLDSDGWSGDPNAASQKKAIEIWSLYSYNLHKATYHGLNHLWKNCDRESDCDGDTCKGKVYKKLEWRKYRRNFIIGRGSFAGMHRYAGLWTGDNQSTWEFLDISVAQVLALGLSGLSIAGADVGGFGYLESSNDYADPELLIRWYCAYSLLPWFRNHYTKRQVVDGKVVKEGKLFQEPYQYYEYYQRNKDKIPPSEEMIYSLLQLLYDAMFENVINGLPIARAMVITDEQDRSLFAGDNQGYTRSQYIVRRDLLVAPALWRHAERSTRRLYLPYPDKWFPMNLRPDDDLGDSLLPQVDGGTHVEYDCHISDVAEQMPYITPMYIREGAIIPKIQVRDCVPELGQKLENSLQALPNPVTIHVYPGKRNRYEMYLDDGISRDSAPSKPYFSKEKACGDEQAENRYCKVVIEQMTSKNVYENNHCRITRTVIIKAPWNKYQGDLKEIIGNYYTVVFWHEENVIPSSISLVDCHHCVWSRHEDKRATSVSIPVDDAHTMHGIKISLSYMEYSEE